MLGKNTEKVVSILSENERLNRRGYKLTEQRQWIVNLLKSEKRHLNAIEIHTALYQKERRVSLATVYRTLDLLVRLGLARKVNVDNRPAVFELDGERDKNREHVHLVCEECGRILDVRLPGVFNLAKTEQTLAELYYFEITNIQITISGLCINCKK